MTGPHRAQIHPPGPQVLWCLKKYQEDLLLEGTLSLWRPAFRAPAPGLSPDVHSLEGLWFSFLGSTSPQFLGQQLEIPFLG